MSYLLSIFYVFLHSSKLKLENHARYSAIFSRTPRNSGICLCCLDANALTMISNVQWSSKAVGVIAIAGVVILYAGYNMWHKSDEAGEAVAGRATGTGGGAGSSGSAPAVAAGPAKFARVLMADVPMDKVIPADLLEEKKDNAPLIAEKNIKIEMRAGKVSLLCLDYVYDSLRKAALLQGRIRLLFAERVIRGSYNITLYNFSFKRVYAAPGVHILVTGGMIFGGKT